MMKSHHVGLLLLMVYSTTASKPNHYQEERYQKFRLQHINPGMRTSECDSEILSRNIETNTNLCKWSNTFITAPLDQIKAICRGHRNGSITSNNPFTFVMCQLSNVDPNNQPRQPNCQYQGWSPRLAKKIVIVCEEEFPIYFETFIP
ncbi:ribonuclease-like 3 [Gadus chalcogrammus]|uniref:ribonuclease-like 3 n=1 Tax=Gadus chalcogrammus TaxID=1042646 RepID=UPI0024C47FA7|nr:ribonuclease-like 3 [Gadus chalcogrammus]